MSKPQFIPLLLGADNSSVFSQGCCKDEIKSYAQSAQPRPIALVSDSSVVTGLIIIIFRKNTGDEVSFTDAFPHCALVSSSREMEALMPGLCSWGEQTCPGPRSELESHTWKRRQYGGRTLTTTIYASTGCSQGREVKAKANRFSDRCPIRDTRKASSESVTQTDRRARFHLPARSH